MVTRAARAPRWEAVAGIVATAVTTALFALYSVSAAESPTDRTPLVWLLALLTVTGPSIALATYLRARRAGRHDALGAMGQVLVVWACPSLVMTILLGLATLVI